MNYMKSTIRRTRNPVVTRQFIAILKHAYGTDQCPRYGHTARYAVDNMTQFRADARRAAAAEGLMQATQMGSYVVKEEKQMTAASTTTADSDKPQKVYSAPE